MLMLGGKTDQGGGPFLLIWGAGALVMGGLLVTKKGSGWVHSLALNGLESNPRQRTKARTVSLGFVRFLGGFFVLAGAVALVAAVIILRTS